MGRALLKPGGLCALDKALASLPQQRISASIQYLGDNFSSVNKSSSAEEIAYVSAPLVELNTSDQKASGGYYAS